MKRVFSVTADDGEIKVELKGMVLTYNGNTLTRDEHSVMVKSLATSMMQALAHAPYIKVSLSDIKAKA